MNKLLSLCAAVTLLATGAQAAVKDDCNECANPLQGSFAVTIWNAATPSAKSGAPSQLALPTNPLVAGQTPTGVGTYTGDIDFSYDSQRAPTVAGFFQSGDGAYTGTGGAASMASTRTTIIEFSFTIASALTNLTFSHDDGVSLFNANSPTIDLLPTEAASPNNNDDATLKSLAAGTYNLFYADIGGLPATLCVDPTNTVPATVPTPEPTSIALLGAGLASLGFARRRRA